MDVLNVSRKAYQLCDIDYDFLSLMDNGGDMRKDPKVPIVINSALLKLADVFRQGCNFLKLCVLCVVRQSERHLDKITNVDEFVKRVFAVIHSNDPIGKCGRYDVKM